MSKIEEKIKAPLWLWVTFLAVSFFSIISIPMIQDVAPTEVENISVPTSAITSQFKTYTSVDYGFSVKYPVDGTVSQVRSVGEVGDISDIIDNIVFSSKTIEFTIQIVDSKITASPNNIESAVSDDIIISGKNGKKFGDTLYTVDGSRYHYRIMYSGDASIKPTVAQEVLLKKFTDSFVLIDDDNVKANID
jgi:hypothetical protein